MSLAPKSAVHRQVAIASQRLFVQKLLDSMIWCWTAALLASVVWFLAQPWLLGKQEDWVRWAIAGGIFGVATVVAIVRALQLSPSRVSAALELDGRFQLRERVTTTLMLTPETRDSPAAQALIADANERVARLDVPSRFPVRLSRKALIVPGCAVLLAVVALFYDPNLSTAQADPAKKKEERQFVLAKEVNQDVNNLKKLTQTKWFKNLTGDEDKKLKEEIEQLLKLDPKSEDQAREMAQKIQQVKNNIQDRIDDMKAEQEKKKELQNQLKKLGQEGGKDKEDQDGPAKDVQKALQEGDAEKAAAKMKEIADKLKNDQLNDKDKQDLKKQLDDLKQQLQEAADQKADKENLNKEQQGLDKEKQDLKKQQDELKKDEENLNKDKGKDGAAQKAKELKAKQDALDQKQNALEQKQQALEKLDAQMKENGEKLKDLKEVAKDLDQAQKKLGEGKDKEAGDKLGDAADKLKKMGGNDDKDMKQLKEGMGMGGKGEPKNLDRPFAEGVKMGAKDDRVKGKLDVEQGLHVSGQQSGGSFKKFKAADLPVRVDSVNQESPGVIESQNIPEDRADFVKGYVQNVQNPGGGKKK